MGIYAGLVRSLFKWAFYLALAGQIGSTTYDMMRKAAANRQLVSLSAINRQLMGPTFQTGWSRVKQVSKHSGARE